MKTALIVVSDLHINSEVAICPPIVNKDDGNSHHAGRTQMWLWRSWQSFWNQVRNDYQGYRKILVCNGDLGELDTAKRSVQLITLNKATILKMVLDTLEPALDVVDAQLFTRGTAAHTGKSAWLEEAIADDLKDTISPTDKIASWWHYRGVCEGVRLDIAHHASAGGKPWAKGGGALRLASQVVWHYRVDRGADPPHVVIRSHNHQYSDSGGNFETFAFFTRAWTSATEYVFRIGQENSLADVGGHVIACEDGKWSKKDYTFEPREARRVWAMKL
jgi:hypothetical protein